MRPQLLLVSAPLIRVAPRFFRLPPLLFILTLRIKLAPLFLRLALLLPLPSLLRAFLLLSLTFRLALLIFALPALLLLRLPFVVSALLIGLSTLLLPGLSLVVLSLALSLLLLRLLLGFRLFIPLLSLLPCLPLPVGTVLRFLGLAEACARQSQDGEHQQDRETTNVICFHDVSSLGRGAEGKVISPP